MKNFSSFTEAYHNLLLDVYEHPEFSSAPRGHKIREKLGVSFSITNPRDRLPFLAGRDFSISYFVAESLWYLSGNDSTEWISNYSSFWKNISDDGSTANSAYGARIFKPHARIAGELDPAWTQWKYVVDELISDSDSRRAVIHIRSPQDSILAKKDVPCTLSLQFFLRNDLVYMVVSMRSSDLILGLAYDVPAFTLFQELLAFELSNRLNKPIGLGTYTHVSNSLHIYERHFKMVEEILSSPTRSSIEMPPLPTEEMPISSMMSFEKSCRNAGSCQEIDQLLSNVVIKDYWKDWLLILASHRASKFSAEHHKKIMNQVSFKGYKVFNK